VPSQTFEPTNKIERRNDALTEREQYQNPSTTTISNNSSMIQPQPKDIDESYNSEAQPLEYECLKLDSANEIPTTSPVDINHHMEIDHDSEMLPPLDVDPFNDEQHDTLATESQSNDHTIFAFSRMNYMNPVQAWSTAGKVIEGDSLPAMVRSNSGSLSSSDTDDTMSSSSGASDGSDDDNGKASKGVTFNETVRVMPIPPLSAYSAEQRFRMYANRFELRENKIRNKKEFQFDGYDWRNATEECHMAICPLSGEQLHPAHL
jgi:hypothetical protein